MADLPALLALFLFVLLMAVISIYGYRAYVRPSRIYDRVGGMADVTDQTETAFKPRDVVVRVFEQVGETGAAGRIVLGPDAVPDLHRHVRRGAVERGDHLQPVREHALMEADRRHRRLSLRHASGEREGEDGGRAQRGGSGGAGG